jgi:hypothetical protein
MTTWFRFQKGGNRDEKGKSLYPTKPVNTRGREKREKREILFYEK